MGSDAADPKKTQQWEGHLRHRKHLDFQERERRLRHKLTETPVRRKRSASK